jgi:hypothetical protein
MTRGAALVTALSCMLSCTLEPEVGRLERACVADNRYDRPAGFDGTGPDPRCGSTGPTVENDCDRCENEHCCQERFGCYDDTVCRCSDQTFDACLDVAASDDAASSEAATSKCAADFEATGTAAEARLACRERACKTECQTPKR